MPWDRNRMMGSKRGDILVRTDGGMITVPIGNEGEVPIASAAEDVGIKWGPIPTPAGVADTKAGVATSVTEGTPVTVTFNTAFATTPIVVAVVKGTTVYGIAVTDVSTTGFKVDISNFSGGSPTADVCWFATDAGDP